MSENNSVKADFKHYLLEIVKAVMIALILSLILVLLSAFIIKVANLDSNAVVIFNQIIRSVSILVSGLFALRLHGNGWLRGIIVGFIYSIFAYLIFSLIGGEFTFDLTLLNNIVLGMASGLISGIIAMLIRRK